MASWREDLNAWRKRDLTAGRHVHPRVLPTHVRWRDIWDVHRLPGQGARADAGMVRAKLDGYRIRDFGGVLAGAARRLDSILDFREIGVRLGDFLPLEVAEQTLRSRSWRQQVASEFRDLLEELRKDLTNEFDNRTADQGSTDILQIIGRTTIRRQRIRADRPAAARNGYTGAPSRKSQAVAPHGKQEGERMGKHLKIDYVEFPSTDIARTKAFFSEVFGWKFVDYGPNYVAISEAGLDGGFYLSDQSSRTDTGAALIVLYSDALEETRERVVSAGGRIVQDIFEFPGGRRFHFTEPSGSEFAVWTAA